MDCPINRAVVSTPLRISCRGVPLSIWEGERKLIYCPGRPPLPPSGGVPILLPLLPSGGVPILLPPVPSGGVPILLPPVPSGGVPMPPPG